VWTLVTDVGCSYSLDKCDGGNEKWAGRELGARLLNASGNVQYSEELTTSENSQAKFRGKSTRGSTVGAGRQSALIKSVSRNSTLF
jgi:hypothetical protein